jgi:hypothetical protein
MNRAPKQKHHRHAVIHLPPLDPEQALDVISFLEKAIHAIWRAHGDAIADFQAMKGIETPAPPGSRSRWPAPPGDSSF